MSRMASFKGPFSEFRKNRQPMLNVVRMHRDQLSHVDSSKVQSDLFAQAVQSWDKALEQGDEHGYRNCQATVLAPTGTVGFMMDCDTTGVEPEMALVKYKNLSGGGHFRIVNTTVSRALQFLGYAPAAIRKIVEHVEEVGTVEGAEDLNPEHLPVFDCAFKPINGERFISPEGHLRMMAAVQPFISGAISKTINLPKDTSVDQIEQIFRLSWRLGLKAVAVYRDGCKAEQPVNLTEPSPAERSRPVRRRLPVDCTSVRHKFQVGGQKGYIHTGFYEDGKIGEIFICMAKEGSTISGLMDTVATLTSIALQYGVPLETLVNKFSHVRFEPSGFTSNPDIPMAKSLTDYIFRYLGIRFLTEEQQRSAGLLALEELNGQAQAPPDPRKADMANTEAAPIVDQPFDMQSDAPACQECGAIMIRSGSCYKCLNCGASNGCS
ncbi:hypothetical protein ACFL2Q_13770 [Thermodesulfobacteriota bacterium]